tara:strand:- start:351 stop:833 length:483 start_codon:yes stop_codon:yes gene_type:complete
MKFKITKIEDGVISVLYENNSTRNFGVTSDLTKNQIARQINLQLNSKTKMADDKLPFTIDQWEELDDYNTVDYKEARRETYPTISEQLDALHWARQGDDTQQKAVDDAIKVIKARYPKDMKAFTLDEWEAERISKGYTRVKDVVALLLQAKTLGGFLDNI